MQVFKIKVSSLLIHSLITWIIIFGGMAIGLYMALLHANDIYFFLLILFGFSALVFLPELLANASIEWSFSEKEIKIKWLSQFLFHKKSDAHFAWEDIQEYKYQPEKRFDLLELKLRDNTTFKYGHSRGGMFRIQMISTNLSVILKKKWQISMTRESIFCIALSEEKQFTKLIGV